MLAGAVIARSGRFEVRRRLADYTSVTVSLHRWGWLALWAAAKEPHLFIVRLYKDGTP